LSNHLLLFVEIFRNKNFLRFCFANQKFSAFD